MLAWIEESRPGNLNLFRGNSCVDSDVLIEIPPTCSACDGGKRVMKSLIRREVDTSEVIVIVVIVILIAVLS